MTLDNNNDVIGLILGLVSLVGVIFTVYKSYHKPQEDLEKDFVVSRKDIDNKASILAQKEMESKAAILAEQFRMRSEITDKRFETIVQDNKDAMVLAYNHTHTVDMKVDELIKQVNMMNLTFTQEFTKLSTILSERLPGK